MRRNEFAFGTISMDRDYLSKEVNHGTRTLALVVPPSPGGGQGLLPKIRPVPALGPRRRVHVGRPARPPGLLGLRRPPLEHHPTATVVSAVARHDEPADR